jgi:SAM-dependent methyltransferase
LGSIYFRQHYNSYGEEEIMKMAANKVRVTTGFEEDRKLWDFIWSKEVDDWDNLSEVIYSTLVEEMGSLKGKKILEAGSGSGKISLRLALKGADVTLFDYSEMALIQAKKLFNRYGLEPKLVQADLRKILPFEDDSFDIVFNAGVMEHFTENQQIQIIKEFGRIGVELHTFNPNSNSFFYQLGKWVAEEANIWPYGKEYPVNSMKNIFEKAGFNLEIEYSVGFESSLYFLDYIKDGKTIREIIQMFIKSLNPATRDMFMDRLGRYLIYSKGIRKT